MKDVTEQEGYYFLRDMHHTVAKRIKAKIISHHKKQKLQRVLPFLTWIPTICLIGISGSVAVSNAEDTDDIDLFIITKRNTIWLTRLWLMFILQMLGIRRIRSDVSAKDKVCLNMFVDEDNLHISPEKQDLYVAHEVVQLVPVYSKHDTYNRFLSENTWVCTYLPHSFKNIGAKPRQESVIKQMIIQVFTLYGIAEKIAKIVQLAYMHRRKTTETVTDYFLAFHPRDNRKKILQRYEALLRIYDIV